MVKLGLSFNKPKPLNCFTSQKKAFFIRVLLAENILEINLSECLEAYNKINSKQDFFEKTFSYMVSIRINFS